MVRRIKKILLFLGGRWHDFSGFTEFMKDLLQPEGFTLESTYDPAKLLQLPADDYDLVINYTCFAEPNREAPLVGSDRLNEEEVAAFSAWVRDGGSLLSVHASTVLGESHPDLGRLQGGAFLSHPAPFSFMVYPLAEQHSITEGIEAFAVHDEFFLEEFDPIVRLHMVAVDRGKAYPMVWSKSEGRGRVAHIAMGHDAKVWQEPSYQRLMVQAIKWLLAD
jgi:type 1 glutamine amidotransferase